MTRPNPYTCRLLFRIDALLYRLRGLPIYWADSGHLCKSIQRNGVHSHGVALRSHFPDFLFRWAAKIQNRWFWTRKVLSW